MLIPTCTAKTNQFSMEVVTRTACLILTLGCGVDADARVRTVHHVGGACGLHAPRARQADGLHGLDHPVSGVDLIGEGEALRSPILEHVLELPGDVVCTGDLAYLACVALCALTRSEVDVVALIAQSALCHYGAHGGGR